MPAALEIIEKNFVVYRVPRPEWEKVTSIVLHDTDGPSVAGVESHFNTMAERSQARGYHYLVDRNGAVMRLVAENERTSHAAGANRATIGIAYVGGTPRQGSITSKQLLALSALIEDIKERHPIELILGHRHVRLLTNARSPKSDPRISDNTILHIAEKAGLQFDKNGQLTRAINELNGRREATDSLSCLVFPALSLMSEPCKTSLERLFSAPLDEQKLLFNPPAK